MTPTGKFTVESYSKCPQSRTGRAFSGTFDLLTVSQYLVLNSTDVCCCQGPDRISKHNPQIIVF